MSSIIPELGNYLSECRKQQQEITNHRMLLPEPATNMGVSGEWSRREEMGHTFTMNPQERR
jgi:hypothetical protein